MYNSTEMVDPKVVQLPTDKTRRKRLKVVSACSECRRKKTKCNGEKPCAGCIKTNMDCKYSNSSKSRPSNNRPLAASSSSSTSTSSSTTTTTTTTTSTSAPSIPPQSQQQQQQQASRYYQQQQKQQQQPSSNDKTNTTIQAIENRLGVIEDILQILLKQQQQQQQQQQQYQQYQQHYQQHPHQYSQHPLPPHQYQQRSAFVPVEQRNMQVRHSGPYYGDYQNDDDGYNYQQTQTQKRKFDQVEVVDVRLPPPHNYQPSLSESSSTSTTSSICSNSSPKINTIQALLNNENDIKLDYPTTSTKPSAFYRPTTATTSTQQQYNAGAHPNVY